MQARNATIDVSKGLGIVLVVLGHNWLILHDRGELFRVIFSFHMPLFFFLAGVLLQAPKATQGGDAAAASRSLGAVLRSRADSLLKPYAVVLAAIGAFRYAEHLAGARPDFDAAAYLLGALWGTSQTIAWVPMWFLPHLFLALVAASLGLRLVARWRPGPVAIGLMALASLMLGVAGLNGHWRDQVAASVSAPPPHYPGLPWSADLLPVTLAFVLLGHAMRERVIGLRPSWPLLVGALLAFGGLHAAFDVTMDLNLREYGPFAVGTAQALLGITVAIAAAALLQASTGARRVFSYLGAASLVLLIFHSDAQVGAFNGAARWVGHEGTGVALTSLVAAFAVSLAVWELACRQPRLAWLLLPRRVAQASA